ncbi:MAG: hypothetical protein E7663_07255 [Ruminococcaceae bacterium]|nr:hypothetical protein [Oscillospiraceae bacterium]
MTKKIICLILSLLLVLPMLVACSDKGDAIDDTVADASRFTTTLNMWVITENPYLTSQEDSNATEGEKAARADALAQAKAVNDAINKLTKSKFKTQVNIKYFTEDEYYAALENAFVKHAEQLKNGQGMSGISESEETILNEYGVPELKYPTVSEYQVDIMFLSGYERYLTYIENKWIVNLEKQMVDSAQKMISYISESFIRSAAYNGALYAFPNNHGVGEYVYLLADKELMKETSVDLNDKTIYDTEFLSYLNSIYANYTGADKVYPIYSESGKVDLDYAHYWSFDLDKVNGFASLDNDKFSIFGDSYAGNAVLGNQNLLTDANYMKYLATKAHYEGSADYITNDPDAKAAVRIVKGGWEVKAQYEKEGYEVLVMQYPEINNDEIFSSMFAIGAYTSSQARSAEIVTYLNTDAEVRNLLQYGIQDVNYTLDTVTVDEEEYVYAVPTAENAYLMDIAKTGNQFIAYPNSADDVLEWDFAKQQNLQAVKSSVLGFNHDRKLYKLDETSVRIVNAVSEAVGEGLATLNSYSSVWAIYDLARAADTPAKMAEFLLSITGGISYTVGETTTPITAQTLEAALTALQNAEIVKGIDAVQSPYALYREWAIKMGYLIQSK